MKKVVVFLMVLGLVIAGSGMALATSVSLVPNAPNVTLGSTVDVSVDMSVSSGFTMTDFSAVILYDPVVFTYVNPSVVQGAFLTHNWDPMGLAGTEGELRVVAIDWNFGEYLTEGAAGTLFTFTLRANANAPLGLSALSWGYADGGTGELGFDYGRMPEDPESWESIGVVARSFGASINVTGVPEPTTMLLLGLGLIGLAGARRKFKK